MGPRPSNFCIGTMCVIIPHLAVIDVGALNDGVDDVAADILENMVFAHSNPAT
jgi:hypothetical protein